ncbi:MAG: hypothetical protein ACYCQJ_14975 [Nitrososphaerales archaeon]
MSSRSSSYNDQEKEFRPRSEGLGGPVTPYGSGPFLNREAGLNYQEDRDAEGGGLVFWFFMEGNWGNRHVFYPS